MRRFLVIAGVGAVAMTATGCRQVPRGFDSPEPGERVFAVTEAARARDQEAIPQLITLLRSDDPLVRMTTIRTLELLTGETLGYDHAGPEAERERALQRWVQWHAARLEPGPAGDERRDLR
jgi:HEAT repeat protein